MMDLRVFYSKKGRIRYISHLDMNRLMQRALKRSGLPVWYTQGYNPHMYLTFALPLSLGFESEYEIMDIRLCEETLGAMASDPIAAGEWAASRLNAQMPQGLHIFRVMPPQRAVKEIAWCDYRCALPAPNGADDARARLAALFDGAIEVEKTTKRGVQRLDIRPHVELLEASAAGPDAVGFVLRCASGSEMNVNPILVLHHFCGLCGIDPDGGSVCRVMVRTAQGEAFT